MAKRKTHEEYVAEVAVKRPDITVVGEYVNTMTKIEHRCPSCGGAWFVTPNSVLGLKAKGCARCGIKMTVSKGSVKRRKSHKDYVAELATKNPYVEVVGKYSGIDEKIDHKCKCGSPWVVSPYNALKGSKCPACTNKSRSRKLKERRTPYEEWLKKSESSLTVLEEYRGNSVAILHRCNKGHFVKARPSNVKEAVKKGKSGCFECYHETLRHTSEDYKEWLAKNFPTVQLIDDYKGTHAEVDHLCTVSKKVFKKAPRVLKEKMACCSDCSDSASDANCFYIWENLDDPGVYKVGITSERINISRINRVARKNGMTANVILMASSPNARDIERRALELGDDPRYSDTIDGYTEFRRYSDAELGEVWRMAVGA